MGALAIQDIKLYQYRLPLKKILRIRNRRLKFREGLILELIADNGLSGFGEVAPLPGLSQESLQEAKEQIKHWIKSPHKHIPVTQASLFPSVRFGLEMAASDLPSIHGEQLFSMKKISVSGLLDSEEKDISHLAKLMVQNGFRSLKLKVGRRPVEKEIKIVRQLEHILRHKATLRLDANQSWDIKTAIHFTDSIDKALIDYIEEPLQNIRGLAEFYNKTNVPVALDESLQKFNVQQLLAIPGLKAVVLKPTVLGGFSGTLALIKKARAKGIAPVISSSFESSLGVIAILNFAALHLNPCLPAGIDTLKWFKNDLLIKPLSFNKPVLKISDIKQLKTAVNFDLLKPIPL